MLAARVAPMVHFGTLYFAQGVILAYFLTFNILYLRDAGFAADEIGFFQATLVLPFVLKLLLGVVSDRYSLLKLGHRYPYIVLGLLLQCLAFGGIALLQLSAGLWVFFGLAMTAAAGMAMYDTSTDGLAVESTPVDARARIQAVMVGARAAGILFVLLAGGRVIGAWGWTALFSLVVLFTLPALMTTLWRWRSAQPVPHVSFDWSAFRLLLGRERMLFAALGTLFALVLDGVLSYLSFHPLSGSVSDIGTVSSLVALSMFGRIVGAAINGGLGRRLGQHGVFKVAVLASACACAGLALNEGVTLLAIACVLFGMAYGLFTAAYAASAMALTDARVAASQFAIFMMFLNIGVALGQAVGGVLVDIAGFQWLAVSGAVLVSVNLFVLRSLRLS